jgi:hypothetical protein
MPLKNPSHARVDQVLEQLQNVFVLKLAGLIRDDLTDYIKVLCHVLLPFSKVFKRKLDTRFMHAEINAVQSAPRRASLPSQRWVVLLRGRWIPSLRF